MENVFIGVDISKDHLDVAVCEASSKSVLSTYQVTNTITGFGKMIKKACKFADKQALWVCFEHTGHYDLLLRVILQQRGIQYSAVSALEIKRSLGLIRGKNDQLDAQRIAQYAATHAHKLVVSQLPSSNLLKIKNLLTLRRLYSKQSTQLKNSLKSLKICHRVTDLGQQIQLVKKQIQELKRQIENLEYQVLQVIESDAELQNNYRLVTSVKGVGFVIAAYVISHTSNFTSFDDPRKFNCYCGLAPFEHSSGSSIKRATRTSHLRHRKLKGYLTNGARSAAQYDKQLKAYFERKLKEGKHAQSIINAIACKLVYRIFAVIKRQEPYVNLAY